MRAGGSVTVRRITVIGKNHKQAFVSLVERKSGYLLNHKIERKTADAVAP